MLCIIALPSSNSGDQTRRQRRRRQKDPTRCVSLMPLRKLALGLEGRRSVVEIVERVESTVSMGFKQGRVTVGVT
jgi:hypothetical protein